MSFRPCPSPPAGRPVLFQTWQQTLATAPLPPGARGSFGTEIGRFLRYCEILQAPVTSSRARSYLARIPVPAARPLARQALRWFFQTARRSAAQSAP
jgi:hypothetical protein